MSEPNLIHVQHSAEGFTHIQLNRPAKRNALTIAMYKKLTQVLNECAEDDDSWAVLLSGSEGQFCSGNDLHDFSATQMRDDVFAVVSDFMVTLLRFPKPVVAAVEGKAVGIGATMLLHCDLVVASPGAEFLFPFVDLGLCPEFGSSCLLPERVGYHRAAEWFMLAESVSAADALSSGFVNSIASVPLVAAMNYCRRLRSKPLRALKVTKALLKQHKNHDILRTIDRESARFAEALTSDEFRVAASNFFNRSTTK